MNSMSSAPVALFTYNRPWHTEHTVRSLLANRLAPQTDLFVFSDAPKNDRSTDAVSEVRRYIRSIGGFRSVTVIERESNFGLAGSIVDGVTTLCRRFGRVIAVEDDLLVSPYFLDYVNDALDAYEHDDRVVSVGCYVFPTQHMLPETFFLQIPDCWGWAVWERSWRLYRSDGEGLLRDLAERGLEKRFDFEGSHPYTEMLRAQIRGENDSWAVRWYASTLLAGGLTVYPGQSMTRNIGFDGSGTHCGFGGAYEVGLIDRKITLADIPVIESEIGRQAWREFFMRLRPRRRFQTQVLRARSWLRKMFA